MEYTLSLTLNKIILEIRICLVIFTVTKELFHIHVSKETGTCSTWNRSEATMIYGINRVLLKITISRIKTVHVMCKQKNDSHSFNLKIYNLSTANMYKKTHTSRFAPWTSFFYTCTLKWLKLTQTLSLYICINFSFSLVYTLTCMFIWTGRMWYSLI